MSQDSNYDEPATNPIDDVPLMTLEVVQEFIAANPSFIHTVLVQKAQRAGLPRKEFVEVLSAAIENGDIVRADYRVPSKFLLPDPIAKQKLHLHCATLQAIEELVNENDGRLVKQTILKVLQNKGFTYLEISDTIETALSAGYFLRVANATKTPKIATCSHAYTPGFTGKRRAIVDGEHTARKRHAALNSLDKCV
ncbi:hypothetical protein C8F01DRAFT_1102793 [Mycena amicta]|nr:hypothetical protein C8F01DRAFT_1102793 [Mycena amicta]